MAGSYEHCVGNRTGRLLSNDAFPQMIENLGDAYEAVEELFGMVWLLADGDPARVEDARRRSKEGLDLARPLPGVQP